MSDVAKILIADDEPPCIDFVRETFADLPYEVISAADGEEALQVAREQNPDLIILDVQMPKRSGFDVFTELRHDEKLSSVPVIMLTGIAERTGVNISGKDMGEFMDSEPEAYVDKPIEPIVLQQTVKRLLAKSE
ncbi:MAG: response regulator [Planctomycetota bacterium]|jgi:CheY-like chemotaxis protein